MKKLSHADRGCPKSSIERRVHHDENDKYTRWMRRIVIGYLPIPLGGAHGIRVTVLRHRDTDVRGFDDVLYSFRRRCN